MMGKRDVRAWQPARGWSSTALAAGGRGDLSSADKETRLAVGTVPLQLVASWCQTERDMKRVPWLSGLQAEDKWGEVHRPPALKLWYTRMRL